MAMPETFPLNVTVPPCRKKLRISARCRSMEKPNEKLCLPRIQLSRSDHSKPFRMKAPHKLSPELKNPDTLFDWIMEQLLSCCWLTCIPRVCQSGTPGGGPRLENWRT